MTATVFKNNTAFMIVPLCALLLLSPACEEHPLEYKRLEFLDYTVTYRVEGTTGISKIDCIDSSETYIPIGEVELPWSFSYQTRGNAWVGVRAESRTDSGTLIGSIFINDNLYQSDTSDIFYNYAGVSAYGRIFGHIYTKIVTETY